MEQNKTKMEVMLRSILDKILESKLMAILSSILEAIKVENFRRIDDLLQYIFWNNESEDG